VRHEPPLTRLRTLTKRVGFKAAAINLCEATNCRSANLSHFA